MAASVAAQLSKETNTEVQTVKGGLGEFSVFIDGKKVINTNRLWYPSPKNIVTKTRALMTRKPS